MAEREPLVPEATVTISEEARRNSKAVVCCVGWSACLVVCAGLFYLYFVLLNIFSSAAIEGLLVLNETSVDEFCELPPRSLEQLTKTFRMPGCEYLSDRTDEELKTCGEPCYSGEFLKEMQEFNKANPGEVVKYKSRHQEGFEDAELGGWWMPAPTKGSSRAPTIVMQSGFSSNSNKYRQQVAAFQLRKMGFSVLMNNFRDHCYSKNTSQRIYQWGYSYPYDVLGAWDYAVNDPDGKLGGKLAKEKVGLMGFSKGGYTVLNCFGLEGDVPGVWADSPPITLREVLAYSAQQKLSEYGVPPVIAAGMVKPFIDNAMSAVLTYASEYEVDPQEHEPMAVLPQGPPTKRPIQLVRNVHDELVISAWGEELEEFLGGQQDKYETSVKVYDEICEGQLSTEDHCADHLRDREGYSELLCNFWTKAFKLEDSFCAGKHSGK
mmetsp:Transcript_20022/g.36134  ORF Transcript_20022/g.36134 Transcript_20022/m.36134 type:complete len:435 (+) Transcript_20022:59-1363(+)